MKRSFIFLFISSLILLLFYQNCSDVGLSEINTAQSISCEEAKPFDFGMDFSFSGDEYKIFVIEENLEKDVITSIKNFSWSINNEEMLTSDRLRLTRIDHPICQEYLVRAEYGLCDEDHILQQTVFFDDGSCEEPTPTPTPTPTPPPPKVSDCAGRKPPSHMIRSTSLYAQAPAYARPKSYYQDTSEYNRVFGVFPGGGMVSSINLAKDEYASLKFSFGEGLPDNWKASLQVVVNQYHLENLSTTMGPIMWSISTCPGDFNKQAIEEDPLLGEGCYKASEDLSRIRYGGPAYLDDPNICSLSEGVEYYLNFVPTLSISGTNTDEILWNEECLMGVDGSTTPPTPTIKKACANAMQPSHNIDLSFDEMLELKWYYEAFCEINPTSEYCD